MQHPDLSSLKTRLASNALTHLPDLIEAAGAANVRSVILTFDDKQYVQSIVVEFLLHSGMGGLELRKRGCDNSPLLARNNQATAR